MEGTTMVQRTACALALLLVGCGKEWWWHWHKDGGGGPAQDGGGAPLDSATPETDASAPDEDAGAPTSDAATPDAGEPALDAGEPAPDAGEPTVDAGLPDTGTSVLDAGAVLDAAPVDSGDELRAALDQTGVRVDARRLELVLGAYCVAALGCEGSTSPVAECVAEEQALYQATFGAGSIACRDAVIDSYACIAGAGCDDPTACDAQLEQLDALCE